MHASIDDSQPGKTAHTKFAVNVEMWWTDLDFLERIRRAAKFGYPAFEFWEYENQDVDAIAELAKEINIEVSQFTGWGWAEGMNSPSNESKFIAQMEEACKVAHKLNCRKMTIVAGDDQPDMTTQQMLDQVTKALKLAVPILERENVMAILEPMNERVDHPGHCLYGSEDGLRICREVNSPMVKLNWDLYHMQITEGDLCGHLQDGIDQIGYLQVADHPGRHEPGTGEVNYRRVLQTVEQLGYHDYVGLECIPQDDELSAAIRIAEADNW